MIVRHLQKGKAFPEYEAPQFRQTDFCVQGVICESFSIPNLEEEDLDITWETGGDE